MKKSLLKLMVRFSLPISMLTVFGALSGCTRIGRITGSGPTGGTLPPPESGEVEKMLMGDVMPPPPEEILISGDPVGTTVSKDAVPIETSGIMMPQGDAKDSPSEK